MAEKEKKVIIALLALKVLLVTPLKVHNLKM